MSRYQIVQRPAFLLITAVAVCLLGTAWAADLTGQSGQDEQDENLPPRLLSTGQANGGGGASASITVGEGNPKRSNNFIEILPGAPEQTPREATQAVRNLLRQHTELDFQDVALVRVADFLDESLTCPVTLDEQELQLIGIDPEVTTVTCSYHHIPLDLALRHMLPQLDMGYYIDGGLLVLTSKERAETQLYTEVYDCEGLLRADDAFLRSITPREPAETAEEPVEQNDGAEGANEFFIAQVCFQVDGPGRGVSGRGPFDAGPQDRIIDVITSTTGTDENNGWLNEGTGAGTLKIFAGKLVVSQTEEVHEEIVQLLNLMREALANATPEDVRSAVR